MIPGGGERVGSRCSVPDRDDSSGLTEEDRQWAKQAVSGLPPLTDRRRDILALLLVKRR